MRYGYCTVTTLGSKDGIDTLKLAMMLVAPYGGYHFVNEVVDVEQLELGRTVVDGNGQVVGNVIAEGSHCRVVVGTAPFAKEIGETIYQHSRTGGGSIVEEQLLACLLALAIFARTETSGEGGLDRRAEHYGAGIVVLAQGIEQCGCKAEIALHKLVWILRAIDPGKVEHKVGFAAIAVELVGSRVDVVLEHFIDHNIAIELCLAVLDIVELCHKIAPNKAFGPGN